MTHSTCKGSNTVRNRFQKRNCVDWIVYFRNGPNGPSAPLEALIKYNIPSDKYVSLPPGVTQIRMARTDYAVPGGTSGSWVTQSIGTQSIAIGPAMMQANRFCSFSSTSDGLSNTVLMIEDAGRPYRYGRGFTKRGPDSDGNDSDGGWGDRQNVSLAMISAFVSRQGGEILPEEVQ